MSIGMMSVSSELPYFRDIFGIVRIQCICPIDILSLELIPFHFLRGTRTVLQFSIEVQYLVLIEALESENA